ncbi:MAG: hypothetical protein ACE5JQ_15090 [Candidatus Methylomirabilales bacterium]
MTEGDPEWNEFLVKILRNRGTRNDNDLHQTLTPSIVAENQNAFRAKSSDHVTAPLVLFSDDATGILVFEYVSGTNLKDVLRRIWPSRNLNLQQILKRTGEALSRWHSTIIIKEPSISAKPNIKDKVVSFFDFSAWNVIVSHNLQSIWLVDFPGVVQIASRHRDLASYLHSLMVISHHPTMVARIPRWWTWRKAFATFLKGYGEAARIEINAEDLDLIRDELRRIVLREIVKYRSLSHSLRARIEMPWYSLLRYHPALGPKPLPGPDKVVDAARSDD